VEEVFRKALNHFSKNLNQVSHFCGYFDGTKPHPLGRREARRYCVTSNDGGSNGDDGSSSRDTDNSMNMDNNRGMDNNRDRTGTHNNNMCAVADGIPCRRLDLEKN
jgi:hypothetical protein